MPLALLHNHFILIYIYIYVGTTLTSESSLSCSPDSFCFPLPRRCRGRHGSHSTTEGGLHEFSPDYFPAPVVLDEWLNDLLASCFSLEQTSNSGAVLGHHLRQATLPQTWSQPMDSLHYHKKRCQSVLSLSSRSLTADRYRICDWKLALCLLDARDVTWTGQISEARETTTTYQNEAFTSIDQDI